MSKRTQPRPTAGFSRTSEIHSLAVATCLGSYSRALPFEPREERGRYEPHPPAPLSHAPFSAENCVRVVDHHHVDNERALAQAGADDAAHDPVLVEVDLPDPGELVRILEGEGDPGVAAGVGREDGWIADRVVGDQVERAGEQARARQAEETVAVSVGLSEPDVRIADDVRVADRDELERVRVTDRRTATERRD